jgi:hypothetical protein
MKMNEFMQIEKENEEQKREKYDAPKTIETKP